MVAAAIIGSAVVGGVVSASGAHSAASAQQNAANTASGTQLAMFNQTRDDQAPFRQAGYSALSSIMGGFGAPTTAGTTSTNPLARGAAGSSAAGASAAGGIDPGFFSHQFNADDLKSNLAPNYDFMLKQGQGATNNFSNMAGGLGGNTFKAMEDYTSNYAQNAYQQAYTNYTSNQTNIFNRLASIAGLGQTAGSNQTSGGSTYAGNIANSQIGAGNARAAGIVGGTNAAAGAIGSVGNYYLLQSLMNGGAPAAGP